MIRYLIVYILIFLGGFGWSQSNTIQWESNHKLEWQYFAGLPQAGSHHHALTASGISIDMKQTSEDSVSIVIDANFYPKRSWLRKGKETDRLLNHEQRHFDIAEIYRRKLVKAILTSDVLRNKTINQDIDKLYSDNDTALRAYQNKYDEETKHSQRLGEQDQWNIIIDEQLQSLEEYDIHIIKFPLDLIMTSSSTTQTSNDTTTKRKRRKRKKRK